MDKQPAAKIEAPEDTRQLELPLPQKPCWVKPTIIDASPDAMQQETTTR